MKHNFKYTLILLMLLASTVSIAQKTSISEVMQKEMMKSGTDAAIKQYEVLKKTQADKYDFSESQLRDLGLGLFQMGRQMDAKKLLKLNSESFPKSSDAFYYRGLLEYRGSNIKEATVLLKKSIALNKANVASRDLLTAIENPAEYAKYPFVCAPCGCAQHDLKFKDEGACIQCGMKLVKVEAKK